MVGFRGLGVILTISFLVTAFTDYPTGVLADWIGHKWVLSLAYVFYGLSSAFLAFSQNFSNLVIAYVFLALANGQSSGTLQSWFDNSYKTHTSKIDPNKEHYTEFLGRVKKYSMFSGSIFFLIGGYLAFALPNGRRIVFFLQALALFLCAVLFYVFLENKTHKDNEKVRNTSINSQSKSKFIQLLSDGLKFTVSSKLIFLLMISSVLLVATSMVWLNLILFPLYLGYSGSDAGAGTYRWILWFSGGVISMKAGQLANKISAKSWIPKLNALQNTFYIGFTALIIIFIPINPARFKLIGLVLIYLNFVIGYYFLEVHRYLKQKLYLDIIPDEMRNSIYSLLPTLGLLLSAPLILIMSRVLDENGFSVTLGILLLISLVACVIEYLALQYYEPTTTSEIIYDTYQVGSIERVQIPQQWHLSSKIRTVYDDLNEITTTEFIESEKEMDDQNQTEELLYDIMINLKAYASVFEKSNDDGIITESERVDLSLMRNDLLHNAEAIVHSDQILTKTEEEVIDKLKIVMMDLQEEEGRFYENPKLIVHTSI
jgi:MFS family permease